MRSFLIAFLMFTGVILWVPDRVHAQDKPLTVLPYTPSLDVTFMDKSVDPCVNFYKYACGNWNKLNPIPADEEGWNVYTKLGAENERFLWGLLAQAEQGGASRTPNEQKIGDYFAACMNTSAIEAAGADPLQEGLKRISQLRNKNDIASYVAWQHIHGDGDVLFNFTSGQEFADATHVIAFINAGGLNLPDRDYYTDPAQRFADIRKRYQEHVKEMLQLLGESEPDATGDAVIVMSVETELAKASLTMVDKRDPYKLNHPTTSETLRGMTPQFDWDVYLQGVGQPELHSFNVSEPKFFGEMNSLLDSRPLADWRAYLRWHLLHSHAAYLSARFDKANFEFYGKFLRGLTEQPPRWKKCTRLVDRDLGEALGEVFVSKTFSPSTKQAAVVMTEQIEKEMGDDIRQLTWMSEPTKQQALLKLRTIVNKIGYPDRWREYSSVSIVPDDFTANVIQARTFEAKRDLGKIGKPLDRGEWGMTPPTVNAYYDAQMNDINFPAGVLQPPLYDPKLDDAPNYGDTGATIGHELTHGFDDEGRQFDDKGNLRDWWTSGDAKAFNERLGCVRAQYAQYTIIDDIKIKSELTSGEDVADLGGTLLAYLAWKHETAGKQLDAVDGLTPDQRFFVGMAQWACGDMRPESKRLHAVTDPHSPDEFRINGVVSDLPDFGKAFACKPGQPMLRVNACRVW